MKKIFRSRGIRIVKKRDIISEQMKIYYEAVANDIDNKTIKGLVEKNILSLFEYSVLENDLIDTYNFHVNLMCDYQELYGGLCNDVLKHILNIPMIFDASFKNYTVGYRFDENQIVDKSFYFYPTVKRFARYGIKGITDMELIEREVNSFAKYVSKNDKGVDEIIDFGKLIHKLKGVSIHISGERISYKLYGRIESNKLKSFLQAKMDYNLDKNSLFFGDVVLAAQRVQNGKIEGYNIYYLK